LKWNNSFIATHALLSYESKLFKDSYLFLKELFARDSVLQRFYFVISSEYFFPQGYRYHSQLIDLLLQAILKDLHA